jgi:hypothetical protein
MKSNTKAISLPRSWVVSMSRWPGLPYKLGGAHSAVEGDCSVQRWLAGLFLVWRKVLTGVHGMDLGTQ